MTILKDVRRRVAAVIEDAVAASAMTEWVVYPYVIVAESGKYIFVRTGPTTYEFDSEQLQVEPARQMVIRAVAFAITGGHDGEIDDEIDDIINVIRDAFACDPRAEWLISTTYTTPPTYLSELGVSVGADTGPVARRITGSDNMQLTVDFTLTVPLRHIIGGFE